MQRPSHKTEALALVEINKTKIHVVKLCIFSSPPVLTFVFGAQKNRLIETDLLITRNIRLS